MKNRNRVFKSLLLSQILTLFAPSQSHADNRVNSGVFMTTAAGTAAGYAISGTAFMARSGDSVTFVTTHVKGLKPNVKYGSHVHNLPCSMGGGGHYKTNPLIDSMVASNEIWPLLTADSTGAASAFVSTPFRVRPEGQSIVIHDTTAAKGKIACADLMDSVTALGATGIISGTLTTTAAGTAAWYSSLKGQGLIVRANNLTVATLSVSGLAPNKTYGSHVHDMPCAQNGGGPHYKIDTTIAATSEANEIWTILKTDANGAATGFGITSTHLARPSARSIVIHDTVTAARIACIDLSNAATSIGIRPGVAAAADGLVDLGFNTFRIVAQGAYSVRVYTVRGKRVLALSGSGPQLLNLDGMAKGHYFLSIHAPERSGAVNTLGIFIQ